MNAVDQNRLRAIAARTLLDIGAVHIRPDEPFRFTSGRLSPVYVDCRRIISFPSARTTLMQMAVELMRRRVGPAAFDAVAGGETAGIPFAAWIAGQLDLPMLYVRKQPKGFGRNARIEGVLNRGDRVLLVEDLATDGGSKLSFVDALIEAGATVNHCFVIFHYGNFPESTRNLRERGVTLHDLCTWADVLSVAETRGFTPDQVRSVRHFLEDADGWAQSTRQ